MRALLLSISVIGLVSAKAYSLTDDVKFRSAILSVPAKMHLLSWELDSAALSRRTRCEVKTGDPQIPLLVKGSCCSIHDGSIDANETGHPPIAMCHGGKYDGWYVMIGQ